MQTSVAALTMTVLCSKRIQVPRDPTQRTPLVLYREQAAGRSAPNVAFLSQIQILPAVDVLSRLEYVPRMLGQGLRHLLRLHRPYIRVNDLVLPLDCS